MLRTASVLVLLATAWTGGAAAQAPRAASSVVFVFDGDGARVNGERVRHAVANELHRRVVRITDDAAHAAATSVTMAFAGPDEWVLDLAHGDQHVERRVHLRTPSVGALAHLAATLVTTTERADAASGDWVRAVDDEIVDPFGDDGAVFRAPRPVAMIDEIVDPFSPAATTHRYESVIDPWQS